MIGGCATHVLGQSTPRLSARELVLLTGNLLPTEQMFYTVVITFRCCSFRGKPLRGGSDHVLVAAGFVDSLAFA